MTKNSAKSNVGKKQFGNSVDSYFENLKRKANNQNKQLKSKSMNQADSFGQWREADAF
ncbi:hypothetical protein [Alkalihalobacterium alkalinitrilicum]|uniref:hypothetical protein n=1 Tax=Alkalihalobacterium alkalinitrilicum TaxID=427920 RepID=UPI000B1E21DC|nr:hypothetical protein [Alkalihalobacterium alkalinitrilicum]